MSTEQLRGEQRDKRKSCFVLGYTGEVGKELAKELADSRIYERVVLIGRRRVEYPAGDSRAHCEQKQIDFDNIESTTFEGLHVGFCALGTTKGKSGKDGFYKVDHDYIVNAATAARNNGCEHFSIVSAMGADKNSWFFYNEVKGKAEQALSDLRFPRLSVFRPGLLRCDREELRFFERGLQSAFNLVGKVTDIGSVATETVARAMVNTSVIPFPVLARCKSTTFGPNVEVFENGDVHEVAKLR